MISNYQEAAGRHLEDGSLLFENDKFDNAAYLAGYVMECSIKAILEQSQTMVPKSFGHDLGALSNEVLHFARLVAPFVGRYQLRSSPEMDELIESWCVEMRYYRSGHISKITAEKWLRVVEQVYRSTVIKAVLDGKMEVE